MNTGCAFVGGRRDADDKSRKGNEIIKRKSQENEKIDKKADRFSIKVEEEEGRK